MASSSSSHLSCPFCHIPTKWIQSQTYCNHIAECCEFERKNLEECPYGQQCDSNIESHFTRYNHNFEDRATYILNSPSKSRKRRRHSSRTPTKQHTSRTPVKSPRTPRATPNKPPKKSKLASPSTSTTTNFQTDQFNSSVPSSSKQADAQTTKQKSNFNPSRKSLFTEEKTTNAGISLKKENVIDDRPSTNGDEILVTSSPDISLKEENVEPSGNDEILIESSPATSPKDDVRESSSNDKGLVLECSPDLSPKEENDDEEIMLGSSTDMSPKEANAVEENGSPNKDNEITIESSPDMSPKEGNDVENEGLSNNAGCPPASAEEVCPPSSMLSEEEDQALSDENLNGNKNVPLKKKIQKPITSYFTSSNPNLVRAPKSRPTKAPTKPAATVSSKRYPPRSTTSRMAKIPSSSGNSASQQVPTSAQPTQQQTSGEPRCPFYKKIKNTSIAVDAFSYGSIPGIKFYFLTHFHSDHYHGLSKKFPHRVYCSQVTANLVKLKIRLPPNQICPIGLEEPFAIDNVMITLLDANHCPGSVMLLLEFPDGSRYLHTGDFRATPQMANSIRRVDLLYLDTTYCDPMYTFPPQEVILAYVESLVWEALESNPRTLFLCGSYLIGKERLFLAVAEALDSKIWASADKQRVLRCQDNAFITCRLVDNAADARVHVVFMGQLSYKYLQQHLRNFSDQYDQLVAFRPTGWEYSPDSSQQAGIPPKKWGKVLLYGIPYSEHSSFEELKNFVQAVQPSRIIPTVYSGKNKTHAILKSWLKK